jgi:hypothetical protein
VGSLASERLAGLAVGAVVEVGLGVGDAAKVGVAVAVSVGVGVEVSVGKDVGVWVGVGVKVGRSVLRGSEMALGATAARVSVPAARDSLQAEKASTPTSPIAIAARQATTAGQNLAWRTTCLRGGRRGLRPASTDLSGAGEARMTGAGRAACRAARPFCAAECWGSIART